MTKRTIDYSNMLDIARASDVATMALANGVISVAEFAQFMHIEETAVPEVVTQWLIATAKNLGQRVAEKGRRQ